MNRVLVPVLRVWTRVRVRRGHGPQAADPVESWSHSEPRAGFWPEWDGLWDGRHGENTGVSSAAAAAQAATGASATGAQAGDSSQARSGLGRDSRHAAAHVAPPAWSLSSPQELNA